MRKLVLTICFFVCVGNQAKAQNIELLKPQLQSGMWLCDSAVRADTFADALITIQEHSILTPAVLEGAAEKNHCKYVKSDHFKLVDAMVPHYSHRITIKVTDGKDVWGWVHLDEYIEYMEHHSVTS